MKIMQKCTKNARVVLGALAIQTLCVCLGQALAAEPSQPVIVTNGTANPVQVQGTINIGLNPYQHQAGVSDSSTCPLQQCRFNFPPVPQGQRLVITHVSAQVGLADVVLLENGGTALFVPKANSSSSFLGAPVTYYVNSGDTPSARIRYPNTTDHTSLVVDLVGYLVPNQ
jgi:hypothetical protein